MLLPTNQAASLIKVILEIKNIHYYHMCPEYEAHKHQTDVWLTVNLLQPSHDRKTSTVIFYSCVNSVLRVVATLEFRAAAKSSYVVTRTVVTGT